MSDATTERWFYKRADQKKGPIDARELVRLAESGQILVTDHVWREGMPAWLPAADVPDLLPKHVVAQAGWIASSSNRGISRLLLRILLVGLLVTTIWSWLPRGTLRYEKVSGKVTYSDGTPLPLDGLNIRFHSLVRARDAKTLPPIGVGAVNSLTGEFSWITSRFPGDGILAGAHKVTLCTADDEPLPEKVASEDYFDVNRTVLRVETKDKPFHLVVEKP